MSKTIQFIGTPFPKARPDGGTNRAADHGTHRTTDADTDGRTSPSPTPS